MPPGLKLRLASLYGETMRWASFTPSITSKTAEVEIVLAAHAAEHGVDHAGGAVHVEAHLHQAVDHRLDLRFGGALLHHH